MPPWLLSLLQNGGGNYTGQNLAPGGGVNGYPAMSGGGPNMGYPAQSGGQIFGPQGSNVGTGKELGPWTNPFTDAQAPNPAGGGGSFFDRFTNGPRIDLSPDQYSAAGPDSTTPGWLRALMALRGGAPGVASAVMAPTPAETGELPLSMSGAIPQHPASTGRLAPSGMPPLGSLGGGAAAVAPSAPSGGIGSDARYATVPTGSPSDTPRPSGALSKPAGAPSPTSKRARFGAVQYDVPGSNRGKNAPIYTALNLFG